MRSTIHIVSAGDFWLLADGIRRSRQEWWRRTHAKGLEHIDMDGRRRRTSGPRSAATSAGATSWSHLCRAFDPEQRRRDLERSPARPRSRASVGDLGAAPRRSLRRGGCLAGAVDRRRGGGSRPSPAPVSRRLRAGRPRRRGQLGGGSDRDAATGGGTTAASRLSQTRTGRSFSTSRGRRFRAARSLRHRDSCRCGTRRYSSTRGGR